MFPLQLNEEELYEWEKTWRKKRQVQLNFNFQPNLNPNKASEESKVCRSSFPGQEEEARQGLGLFKEIFVAPVLGSRLVGTLLHVTSCPIVSKPNLVIIRDQNRAVLSAQVRSWGNERDECDPVDFNAPRGQIDVKMLKITNFPRCTRSLTTTTWSARRSWSARWWRSPSTSATCPASSSQASSKWTKLIFGTFLHSTFFRMARYLEVLNMPDDFRELLDEYMDASERSDGQKACEEFFQCPYSIKESVKRNFSGNSL